MVKNHLHLGSPIIWSDAERRSTISKCSVIGEVSMIRWVRSNLLTYATRSDLSAIGNLKPEVQADIAVKLCIFIDVAETGPRELLPHYLIFARQQQEGQSSHDPKRIVEGLKESWCAAKAGPAKGIISHTAAQDVLIMIEEFLESHKADVAGIRRPTG